MAVAFDGAGDRLTNAAPAFITYPFTVAAWVSPAQSGTAACWWSLGSTSASQFFRIGQPNTTATFLADADAGSGAANAQAGTITVNGWHFVLGRFISATNRRLAVLNTNGSIAHGQNTTSRAPAVNATAIGARLDSGSYDQEYQGRIAEFWMCDADIQADGAQLQDWMVRQLAYYGPFSVPHLAASIVEYRAFRSRMGSDQDDPREIYCRGLRSDWVTNGNPTLGAHPQLAGGYRGPRRLQMPPVVL
jgi:hypothetical protein